MEEILDGNGHPGRIELSTEDQLIHVTAHSEGLLLDHPDEVILGSLSHEDSGSVGASVFLRHQGDSFACYATVELPERLTSQPLPNILGLFNSLVGNKKALSWDENSCCTPIYLKTRNFISLKREIDGSVGPTIHIYTKGLYERPETPRDEADNLKYYDYPVDEVVIKLGEIVGHITNELHQMSGKRNSAWLDINLPYFSQNEEIVGSTEIVPACRPEHATFPDFEDFGGLGRGNY